MINLCDLLREHSVNLIIYCVRGSRFTDIVRVNYDLFYGIVCEKKVPIVLVVTGLELEGNMDDWWNRYEKTIKRMGMARAFDEYACVTTTTGKDDIYQEEYELSASKVWKLVKKCCRPVPWTVEPRRLVKARGKMDRYMKNYNAPGLLGKIRRWFFH